MSCRMDFIRAQEKESQVLIAAAQYNVSNALQLQCSSAKELELLHCENDLLWLKALPSASYCLINLCYMYSRQHCFTPAAVQLIASSTQDAASVRPTNLPSR